MRGFGLTLECSLEHLLRRHILAAVELDYAAIVKRVSIARQNTLSPQARLRNREIRPRACRDFRDLRVLLYKYSKLVTRLSKSSACKFLMRAFERHESCRLILRRWSWRRWLSCRWANRTNSTNRSLLLRRFDP